MHLIGRPTIWSACGTLYVLLILWLSLTPSHTLSVNIPHFDKVLHAGAHFVLCAWFLPLYHRLASTRILLFSIGLGLSIEGLQHFVPGRSPDVLDLLANTSGALLAILLMTGKPRNQLNLLIYNGIAQEKP